MADDPDIMTEILDDMKFDDDRVDNDSTDGQSLSENISNIDDLQKDERLEQLTEVGLLTDKEYDILTEYYDRTTSSGQQEFGTPVYTSEGSEFDFSIVGVFQDVNTKILTLPEFLSVEEADDTETWDNEGGPGRTIVCFQIYNHSSEEIMLKHKNIEYIGENGIAYNYDGNPLVSDRLEPGWRTDNWEYIGPDTRIQYASVIEMPVIPDSLKLSGYWEETHEIELIDDLFFPKSDLPTSVEI